MLIKLQRVDSTAPVAAYLSSAPKAPASTGTWLATGSALSVTKTWLGILGRPRVAAQGRL